MKESKRRYTNAFHQRQSRDDALRSSHIGRHRVTSNRRHGQVENTVPQLIEKHGGKRSKNHAASLPPNTHENFSVSAITFQNDDETGFAKRNGIESSESMFDVDGFLGFGAGSATDDSDAKIGFHKQHGKQDNSRHRIKKHTRRRNDHRANKTLETDRYWQKQRVRRRVKNV